MPTYTALAIPHSFLRGPSLPMRALWPGQPFGLSVIRARRPMLSGGLGGQGASGLPRPPGSVPQPKIQGALPLQIRAFAPLTTTRDLDPTDCLVLAVSPAASHATICARYGSTFERRYRFVGARSTGSRSARATVRRFRPNSAAICRWLLPRLASNWIALRSICRNILPPVTRRGCTTAAASVVHFYFATAAHITFAVYSPPT